MLLRGPSGQRAVRRRDRGSTRSVSAYAVCSTALLYRSVSAYAYPVLTRGTRCAGGRSSRIAGTQPDYHLRYCLCGCLFLRPFGTHVPYAGTRARVLSISHIPTGGTLWARNNVQNSERNAAKSNTSSSTICEDAAT
eukprot:3595572-Rhodomonas_salina.1